MQKEEEPELRFMRWVIQMRQGQASAVMREIEALPENARIDNATTLMVSIARFRTYRKSGDAGGK
jgi:hypothetical protein